MLPSEIWLLTNLRFLCVSLIVARLPGQTTVTLASAAGSLTCHQPTFQELGTKQACKGAVQDQAVAKPHHFVRKCTTPHYSLAFRVWRAITAAFLPPSSFPPPHAPPQYALVIRGLEYNMLTVLPAQIGQLSHLTFLFVPSYISLCLCVRIGPTPLWDGCLQTLAAGVWLQTY